MKFKILLILLTVLTIFSISSCSPKENDEIPIDESFDLETEYEEIEEYSESDEIDENYIYEETYSESEIEEEQDMISLETLIAESKSSTSDAWKVVIDFKGKENLMKEAAMLIKTGLDTSKISEFILENPLPPYPNLDELKSFKSGAWKKGVISVTSKRLNINPIYSDYIVTTDYDEIGLYSDYFFYGKSIPVRESENSLIIDAINPTHYLNFGVFYNMGYPSKMEAPQLKEYLPNYVMSLNKDNPSEDLISKEAGLSRTYVEESINKLKSDINQMEEIGNYIGYIDYIYTKEDMQSKSNETFLECMVVTDDKATMFFAPAESSENGYVGVVMESSLYEAFSQKSAYYSLKAFSSDTGYSKNDRPSGYSVPSDKFATFNPPLESDAQFRGYNNFLVPVKEYDTTIDMPELPTLENGEYLVPNSTAQENLGLDKAMLDAAFAKSETQLSNNGTVDRLFEFSDNRWRSEELRTSILYACTVLENIQGNQIDFDQFAALIDECNYREQDYLPERSTVRITKQYRKSTHVSMALTEHIEEGGLWRIFSPISDWIYEFSVTSN